MSDPVGTTSHPTAPLVLDYRPVVSRPQRRAKVIRVTMLIVAILAAQLAAALILNPLIEISPVQFYLGGGVLGTPFSPLTLTEKTGELRGGGGHNDDDVVQRQYLPRAIGYLALFVVTQWWFLSPRGTWRIGAAPTRDPPPRRAAIAAGFVGMLLCVGLIATLLELPDWWLKLTTENGLQTPQHFGPVWVVMALLWAFWSVVFYHYWRSLDRYTAIRKVFRRLLAGTMLELFIAAPAHALMVAERGDVCYCQRGTWTGVAFGCTAALWLFGPGALLLFLRERKRLATLEEASDEATTATTAPPITSIT